MNEQIIELYKQAQEFAYKNISEEYWNTATFSAVVSGKFAELIVRECIAQCESQNTIITTATGIQHWGEISDAVEQIREHFGVEE